MSAWLRLHGHALADAIRRLAAQPLASATSILVLALAMTLPILATLGLRAVAGVASHLDTEPHVNVFLALDASDEEARRVGDALRSSPAAAAVRFIPNKEAFEEMRRTTHLAEILATLDRNPLPHAFTVRLRQADPAAAEDLRRQWAALPKVDQVVADFEWATRLARWVRLGDRLVTLGAVALALAVSFIVGHLIRLQVVMRREEIEVSQLIGATATDVRRPFLYHGIVQGTLAAAGALGMAAAASAWIDHELSALTLVGAEEMRFDFMYLQEALGVVLVAAALGLVGAWIAVDAQVRRFSRA